MNQADRCSNFRAAAPGAIRGELPLAVPLAHGGTANALLQYEIAGQPDGPLVVVAGGISAGRHVLSSAEFPETGWWEVQAHSLDPARRRILAFDWLGADGTIDSPIDPSDQAFALAALLDGLGEPAIAAFVGASYGAMVGMHFAALYPERCGALLAISAAGRAHPYASACRSLQRKAIRLGEAAGNPASGVALARAMAMLTYRTPAEFEERFEEAPEVNAGRVRVGAESYLEEQGERHCRVRSAVAYRRLSESIDLHRLAPEQLRIPVILVAADSDALVPPADVLAFADAVPGARFHPISSRFGHDAFLKEERQVGAIIANFLSALELHS